MGAQRSWVGAATLLTLAVSAHADNCDQAVKSVQIAQCLADDLRAADAQINIVYPRVMAALGENDRLTLKHAQRAWIKERDTACGLDEHQADRELWYQDLLHDYRKAVCATHYEADRTAELNRLLPSSSSPAPAVASAPAIGQAAGLYNVLSGVPLRTGRWYFEVTIDRSKISMIDPTVVWWGCRRDRTSIGSLTRVHGTDTNEPVQRGGIALDLVAGRLYVRKDGLWIEGAPGSSGGNDVTPGQPYQCGVETTVPITPLIEQGLVRVNFGNSNFEYGLPSGYSPLSSAPAR
jgi:uncharacterized protein YecT (DUF1311 family)